VITLNPIPSEYYEFDQWDGDIKGTAAPATLIMDGSKHIITYFNKIEETITQPKITSNKIQPFRKQEMHFVAGGAESIFGHELEYQFQWDDSSYSAWGDSSRYYSYSENGEYVIRTRARCKIHPDIVSDWSNDFKIQVVGCKLNVTLAPDSAGTINKEPNKFDYDYQEIVTLTANPSDGYFFSNWNGDAQDTTITKLITLKKDTTISAHFDRMVSINEYTQIGKLQYELFQNFPNPFNQQTTITFILAKQSKVVLTIYNTNGQTISEFTNPNMQAGLHTFKWSGKDVFGNEVTSGVFLYHLKTDEFSKINKMLMIK